MSLAEHIIKTAKDINWQSVVLGLAALVLLLVCKEADPQIPDGPVREEKNSGKEPRRRLCLRPSNSVNTITSSWKLPA